MEGQTNALELAISKKAGINQKLFQSQHPPVIHSSIVRDDKQIEFRQAQVKVTRNGQRTGSDSDKRIVSNRGERQLFLISLSLSLCAHIMCVLYLSLHISIFKSICICVCKRTGWQFRPCDSISEEPESSNGNGEEEAPGKLRRQTL